MFGYIKIQKGDLLVKEYETYKSIYCGLCKQLGKDYSFLSRITLSYDCTFYALILLSLSNFCDGFEKKRCVANPFKKCVYCKVSNDTFSKAAAFNVILCYYKLIDDIYDSGIFKGCILKTLKPIFSLWHKKAKIKYPDIDRLAENMMSKQKVVEEEDDYFLDEACDPTAEMLGSILKLEAEDNIIGRILYQLGYGLGRFIYLADAVDDYEDDMKKGRFNPFNSIKENKFQAMNNNLSQSLAMAFDAYNLLDLKNFKGIIDNIILKGLPVVQEEILKKVKGEI